MRVVKAARNNAYKLQELDGTPYYSHVAGFRLIPYIGRSPHVLRELGRSNPALEEALDDEFDWSS